MASFLADNFTAGSTRANTTLTKPAGTAAGQIMLIGLDLESGITPLPPPGWWLLDYTEHLTANFGRYIFWRRALATEPATYTVTHASTWAEGYIVTIQNVSASAIPVCGSVNQNTTNTASSPQVTSRGANAYIGFLCVTFSTPGALTPPTGSTPTFTEENDPNGNVYYADGTLAAQGSTAASVTVTLGAGHGGWICNMIVIEDVSFHDPATHIEYVFAGPQAASNASPQNATLPTDWAPGDRLLLICSQSSAAGVTFSATGFTSIARNSNATRAMTLEIFEKIAVAGEATPSVTCSSAASGWTAQLLALRNADAITLEDAADVSSDGAAAATFTPTGITTVNRESVALIATCSKDDNALAFALFTGTLGWTMAMGLAGYDTTLGTGSDQAILVALKRMETAGASAAPVIRETAVGNDAWVALAVALRAVHSFPPTLWRPPVYNRYRKRFR